MWVKKCDFFPPKQLYNNSFISEFSFKKKDKYKYGKLKQNSGLDNVEKGRHLYHA